MTPQNAIVLGLLLTALVAYLLVLWSGSRIGHGVVILAVGCLGCVATEREQQKLKLICSPAIRAPLAAGANELVLDAIRKKMEANRGQ